MYVCIYIYMYTHIYLFAYLFIYIFIFLLIYHHYSTEFICLIPISPQFRPSFFDGQKSILPDLEVGQVGLAPVYGWMDGWMHVYAYIYIYICSIRGMKSHGSPYIYIYK